MSSDRYTHIGRPQAIQISIEHHKQLRIVEKKYNAIRNDPLDPSYIQEKGEELNDSRKHVQNLARNALSVVYKELENARDLMVVARILALELEDASDVIGKTSGDLKQELQKTCKIAEEIRGLVEFVEDTTRFLSGSQ